MLKNGILNVSMGLYERHELYVFHVSSRLSLRVKCLFSICTSMWRAFLIQDISYMSIIFSLEPHI